MDLTKDICPATFVKVINEFHDGMVELCLYLLIHLKLAMVYAPTLFTLFLEALLSTVSEHLGAGDFIRTKSDGKLFQLARLKASTNTRNSEFVNYYLQMILLLLHIH